MMLAAHLNLVQMREAKTEYSVIDGPYFHSEHGGNISLANCFRWLTSTGAMGNPERTNVEKGTSLLNAAAAEVTCIVAEFLIWKQPIVLKK